MGNVQTGKSVEIESRLVVASDGGGEDWRVLLMGTSFLFGVVMFWNLIVLMIEQLCEIYENH